MLDDIDSSEEERWYEETVEANRQFDAAKEKTISFLKLAGQLAVLAILTAGALITIVLLVQKVFK